MKKSERKEIDNIIKRYEDECASISDVARVLSALHRAAPSDTQCEITAIAEDMPGCVSSPEWNV